MSKLKSFKAHSSIFASKQAKMAISPSYHRVWSHRTCSLVSKVTFIRSFCSRRSPFNNVLPLFHTRYYSTNPAEEFSSGLKRRSRGPVMAAKKASEGKKQEDGKYKHTVDLPKTTFGMRANSVVREPEIQKQWSEERVFKRVSDRNNGGVFVLHDGPPYANGDLHMGHALNKVLKDIINRYKLLQNYKIRYVPGWDCHGLPIELKVLQSMDSDARKELTPIKLRAKAAKFAKQTVNIQMKSFKRFGVWGDWDNPYLTLNPEYEAAQIGVFSEMVMRGFIYRGRKPVHWSPSSRTALAEAELEYPEGHTSRSIYANFKLISVPPASRDLLQDFFPDLCLAIWTTTPWTVPANAGLYVSSSALIRGVQFGGKMYGSGYDQFNRKGIVCIFLGGFLVEIGASSFDSL